MLLGKCYCTANVFMTGGIIFIMRHKGVEFNLNY